jgi:hypothetical protein
MHDPLDVDELLVLLDEVTTKVQALRAATLSATPEEFSPSIWTWESTDMSTFLAALRTYLAVHGVSLVVAIDNEGGGRRCPIEEPFDTETATWAASDGQWVVWFDGPGEIVGVGEIFAEFDPTTEGA